MRAKTIFRNTSWTVLDFGFSMVCGIVLSIFVARMMGPEKLGYFNLVTWITASAGAFGSYGIGMATRKYTAEYLGRNQIAEARAIVHATLQVQVALAALLVVAGAFAIWRFVPPEHRSYTAFAVAALFPFLVLGIHAQALMAAEDFLPNVKSSVVGTCINIAGAAWSLTHGWGLTGLTASLFVSRLVDMGLRAWYYYRCFPKASGPASFPDGLGPLRRRMIAFCWQASVLLLLNVVVWDRSEMIFLKKFCAITAIAFYSLGFNITSSLLTIPNVFAQSAGTTLMVQYGRDRSQTGRLCVLTARYLALFSFPVLLGAAALSSPALHILYGQRYVPAIPVFAVLAVFSIPRSLMLPFQQHIMAHDRQSFLVVWGIISAVLNVALDLAFIPHGGAMGAALGNGLAQLIASAGIVAYGSRKLDAEVQWGLMARSFLSALLMLPAVYLAVAVLPAWLALLVGVPLGGALYAAGLRWTSALPADDRIHLYMMGEKLPSRVGAVYRALIRFVAPDAPAAAKATV